MKFTHNIAPYVDRRIARYYICHKKQGHGIHHEDGFRYLEDAHVLGQYSTFHHTRIHVLMLLHGWRQKKPREVLGQVMRIIGALSKTPLGWLPRGNTGGANISAFRSLPLSAENRRILARVNSNH